MEDEGLHSQSSAGIRLQRVIADAGVASRRAAEDMIAAGRVAVNGHLVTRQGVRVDPSADRIEVDGVPVPTRAGLVHLAVNKPRGMLTTMADPRGRPCVGDLVRERAARLFHVGRLDAETEGLLVLTNDGALAQRLQHPSFGLPKVYLAEVRGVPARDVGKQLRAGLELSDGPARADGFRVVDRLGGTTLVEVTLHEGRNRIVRRLLAQVDLPVQRLVRTQVGPVRLGELRPGRLRALSGPEVRSLYAATVGRSDLRRT
ncbi:MAG: pseudouridine synthase [Actinomycetes bacterium]